MWGLIFLKVWDTEKFGIWLKLLITAACWLTVPLLSLYNGRRGKLRWLG